MKKIFPRVTEEVLVVDLSKLIATAGGLAGLLVGLSGMDAVRLVGGILGGAWEGLNLRNA